MALGIAAVVLGDATPSAAQPLPGVLEREYARTFDGRTPAQLGLRRLWQEWDQGDPAAVEELLNAATTDARLDPEARVYAQVLQAYARRRRGDLDGARTRIAQLGFVGKFLAVGPFDNEGKGGLDRVFGPEEDRRDALSLGRTYDGKERQVRYRTVPETAAYGWVNVGAWVRPSNGVCAFATTFVRHKTSTKPTPATVFLGATGAFKVYLNGALVLKDDKYRDLDVDRRGADITLKPGWNRVIVKICGDEDEPMFSLRFGAANGGPQPDIEASVDLAHARDAAQASEPAGKDKPLAPPRGPLAALERAEKGGDPATLTAFAQYLVATQGDDPVQHKARELAQRAADKSPSIERLLLAGQLAEDRNQQGVWLDKAEALAKKQTLSDRDRVKLLLARANHARSGPSYRDAIPYYDTVLALDPGNTQALLSRYEVYAEAGLRETARSYLEKALAQNPKSVALLRATAASLRELERNAEATALQERYAALRFDDTSYIKDHIELALARRDEAQAARWVDRLLYLTPDSAGSLGIAAKTYIALGQRSQGIATYKRALELAPEDTETMLALASTYAVAGRTDEQMALLRRVLELKPQSKDVREYIAHTEPQKPKADERYAVPSAEFLKDRNTPVAGVSRRTLVDLQVTTVFANGLASRFHQVVFQPQTDAAAAAAREYAFGFEADSEVVQMRGARVYRKNGQVDEAIETGDAPADNPQLVMYTSARVFYVHFPRLYPGDVVELLYRVEDVAQRNAFADYFGEVNYMQSQEPVAHAEYVLITPKSRALVQNQPKVPGLTQETREEGDTRIQRFVAKNVPPVDPEPLQAPASEILGRVHVSTYQSWDDMGKWYWGLVKDQFAADDEVRRRVAEITRGLTDERAKVRAIYDYVVQRTRYVALEFGIHGFKPYRCAQIFARGFGDCKDKATLIVTMLREAGIPATIVIVRTQMRGDFDEAPASLAPFDHAIAYVPSLGLYLDGTAEYTGSNELPSMDRGSLALQINEGKPKLVRLPDPPANESIISRKFDATVSADGSAVLEWSPEVSGAFASTYRQRYHAESSRKTRVQEDIASEYPGFELTQLAPANLEDIETPVRLSGKGKLGKFGRRDGDSFSVPAGPSEYLVREFASLTARKTDVRLGPKHQRNTDWTLRLPPGAKITSVPKEQSGTTPFGSFKVTVETKGQVVHARTEVSIDVSRVPAANYPAFRAFAESADRALGQRVTYTIGR